MNSNIDLVLLRNGASLDAYRVDDALGSLLNGGLTVRINGVVFKGYGACCEWLELVDPMRRTPVGLKFVDFYGGDEIIAIPGLRAANVTWDAEGSADVCLIKVDKWIVQGGPYLPVFLFVGDAGEILYFVPEGVSNEMRILIPLLTQ